MSNYPELITIGFYLQLTTSDLSGYHKTCTRLLKKYKTPERFQNVFMPAVWRLQSNLPAARSTQAFAWILPAHWGFARNAMPCLT